MSKLIDGYLMDDMIVYRGLQKGGYVGRGYRVHPPDCENAEVSWLNRMEDDMRVLLSSLKDTARMQVHWTVDSDYRRELLDYYEQTDKLATNAWSKEQRNERFTRYWDRMLQRELRRERLHWYVTTKIDTAGVPTGKGKRAAYDYTLDACARELRQYEELLHQVFGSLGGHVDALDDRGHFSEFYRFFNPSVSDLPGLDLDDYFDPKQSIVDTCFNCEAASLRKPDLGFYFDGYYHGVLVLKSLPKATFSGMMSQLTNLDLLDYSITVNIQALDVMHEIEREEGAYEKLQHTIQHSPKLRMVAAMHKKGQKIARLMSNEVLPYKAQFIIRVWDAQKPGLRAKLAALRGAISKLNGAQYYDPSLPTSARNYVFASMPGWCWDKYDDFSHYIEDVNLANLLPVSATPTGDLEKAEALYDGANRNLIGVRTFIGEGKAATPQHGVVFGMSGAGKSVNMIDLLTQTEPYYDYTVLVEEGLSYQGYTKTIDESAEPIIIQPNGSLTFNYLDTGGLPLSPLQLSNATAMCQLMAGVQADADKNRLRGAHLSSAIRQLYRDFYDDWARKHPSKLRELADEVLTVRTYLESLPPGSTFLDAHMHYRDLFATGAIDSVPEFPEQEIDQALKDPELSELIFHQAFAYLKPAQMPTHGHLQEFLALESHGPNAEDCRTLAKLLEPWSAGGNYGPILDGASNIKLDGKIAHFELGYIPESAQDLRAVAAFLITNYARNEVLTRPRAQRKRIVLEELSAFLAIPDGDRITREFYERMRKYNCWVISVIQQFGRFYESPVRSSVMGNSRVLFLLKQRDKQDLDRIDESFPLPDITKGAIANFPEPGKQRSNPHASFVYYRAEDAKPVIVTAKNAAAPKLLDLA